MRGMIGRVDFRGWARLPFSIEVVGSRLEVGEVYNEVGGGLLDGVWDYGPFLCAWFALFHF